jgi:hypothetical protein
MKLDRRLEMAHTTTVAMVVLAGGATLAGLLLPGLHAEDVLAIAYGAMALGSLAMSIWFLRARATLSIAPSARLDAWLPDTPFRDTIVARRADRGAGATDLATQVSS